MPKPRVTVHGGQLSVQLRDPFGQPIHTFSFREEIHRDEMNTTLADMMYQADVTELRAPFSLLPGHPPFYFVISRYPFPEQTA